MKNGFAEKKLKKITASDETVMSVIGGSHFSFIETELKFFQGD